MRPVWGCILLAAALAVGGCSARDSAKTSYNSDSTGSAPVESDYATDSAPIPPGSRESRSMGYKAPTATTVARLVVRRQMVRKAALTVRVDNVEKTEKEANAAIARVNGFVQGTESTDLSSSEAQITMTIRVPVEAFDQSIATFEGLGTRTRKQITGEDVTGQVLDYDARLKVMRAQEQVFLGVLKRSRSQEDAISTQEKLMALRENIESTTAQLKGLSELASLSTIELTLTQSKEAALAKADQGWFGESVAQAKSAGGAFYRAVLILLIWLVVFSPVWGAAFLLIRWAVKSSQAKPRPVVPPPRPNP